MRAWHGIGTGGHHDGGRAAMPSSAGMTSIGTHAGHGPGPDVPHNASSPGETASNVVRDNLQLLQRVGRDTA